MKKTRKLRAGENAFVIFLMSFSLFILVMAYRISGFSAVSSPGAFPMAAGLVMVIALGFILFDNRKLENACVTGLFDELRLARKNVLPKAFIIYTGIIICYMLLIQPLHFLPSSFLFLLVSMVVLKGSSPLKAMFISLVSMACVFLVFQFFFRVVMP